MAEDLKPKIFNSFFPLIWSSEPWDIPMLKIKSKEIINKLLLLKYSKADKNIQILKKINEW